MIIIITNSRDEQGFSFTQNEDFEICDSANIFSLNEITNLSIKDKEEYYGNEIAKSLDKVKYKSVDVIVIDKYLGTGNWNRAMLVAGHIATHHYRNCELDKKPIILSSKDQISVKELNNIPITNFFSIEGIFVKTYSELFNKEINRITEQIEYGIHQLLRKNIRSIKWEDFNIPYKLDNRHQISNEWGAHRLALNAGYLTDDIEYEFPPTLYFKYLIKKFQSKEISQETRKELVDEKFLKDDKLNFSNHSYFKNKKILLIDDNEDKGWKAVLTKLFNECAIDAKIDFEQVNQFGNILDIQSYDLVFLDLRLPKIKSRELEHSYGLDLLKNLKIKYPQIPIIIFTASNKSWTLTETSELGADGMYVKESPEYAADSEYSKGNFVSFHHTVIRVLDKYYILRPYWEKIEDILNSPKYNAIQEKGDSKFKERIKERLEMFYGLLKRGFEQTNFNKDKFHFSDHELSFMTLWSVLNEISESSYTKTNPTVSITDLNQNKITNHPGGYKIKYPPYISKWQILNQADVFVEYGDFSLLENKLGQPITNASGNYYKLSYKQKSQFFLKNDIFQFSKTLIDLKINYESTLFIQIAFLIEKKKYQLSEQMKKKFLQNIVSLNETRNKLFITHGDQLSSGFYNKTEKERRGGERHKPEHNINPKQDIKDLFELVAFLLTGDELELIF